MPDPLPSSPRRPVGVVLTVLCFAFLGANAWKEAILGAMGSDPNPMVLVLLQGVVGTLALTTAFGAWRQRGWATMGAVAYGLVAGGMIASLEPILGLGSEARSGLWLGAVAVLTVSSLLALYLRRVTPGRPQA